MVRQGAAAAAIVLAPGGKSLNNANAHFYRSRFRKVLDHIDTHLGEQLDADTLCAIAAFSKFHFHRQFTELFGMSVQKYVQLARLKKASYKLAFRDGSRIVDIAFDSGYEGPEAFARAFRKCLGQSPTGFRKAPQWTSWYETHQPLSVLRTTHMKPAFDASQVAIVDFPETSVGAVRHRGDPRNIGDAVRRLIAWRKENKLPPRVSATFNILYDDPQAVAPEDFRFDVCAATSMAIDANEHGVVGQVIEGGRCAVLRYTGSDDHLGQAVHYLYAQWLPASGEQTRDFPLFVQRVKFFPDVPEHETVCDIHLPLK
jgi:AraC family transcriptional regulator